MADASGRLSQVAEGVHVLALDPSNVYVWLDGREVTLIDTGLPGQDEMIIAALHELGVSRRDVRRVVLSHWHADHSGSAAAIAKWGDVEICAGRGDAAIVRGKLHGPPPILTEAERPRFDQMSREQPPAPACPVHRELDDGDSVDPAGRAVVVATPGHTAGSIAVHFPRLRLVLTGDTAAESDGKAVLAPFNVDRADTHRSLHRLAALDVDVAGFGHGEPLPHHAAQALATATDPIG